MTSSGMVMEKLLQVGKKNVVIISEDIDGEALATLVVNKLRGTLNALAVKNQVEKSRLQGLRGLMNGAYSISRPIPIRRAVQPRFPRKGFGKDHAKLFSQFLHFGLGRRR